LLIAEIHGKICPEILGNEDFITSAVFGHLRPVEPNPFWASLLSKAVNTNSPRTRLTEEIQRAGISFSSYTDLTVRFWQDCTPYGEPDVILHFSGTAVRSLIVLVEVKLDSAKSSEGLGDDQLARYLRFLDDAKFDTAWDAAKSLKFVVYLTRAFATQEIEESVSCSTCEDARRRIFGLEWNDILETADAGRSQNVLLAEVADFLRRRGLTRFGGFDGLSEEPKGGGSFYKSMYFDQTRLLQAEHFRGEFYGN
jgi:hypothetical protein